MSPSNALQAMLDASREGRLRGPAPAPPPLAPSASPAPEGPSTPGGADLAGVFRARRAVRLLTDDPVPVAVLTTMARAARAVDADTWGDEQRSGIVIRTVVIANRVTGLVPGAHELGDDGWRALDGTPPDRERLVHQPDLRSAAGLLLLVADLEAGGARWGPHGYRLQLVRAGMMGHAAWLQATAAGYGACALGRSDGDEVARLCAGDDLRNRQLFAVAVGRRP
jgi:nitroreductase